MPACSAAHPPSPLLTLTLHPLSTAPCLSPQVGESWAALAHIRQAVTFLVIHQKHRKSYREITEDLCGALSVQQLYRISTMYWDDRCVGVWVWVRVSPGAVGAGGRVA